MITISKEQLDTVEYLLQQSAQGNHVLFGVDLVRKVFALTQTPMNQDEIQEVEHHIEKIISTDGLQKQLAYIEQLPQDILYRVIKTYFNIVENNIFDNKKVIQ